MAALPPATIRPRATRLGLALGRPAQGDPPRHPPPASGDRPRATRHLPPATRHPPPAARLSPR